MSIIWNSSPLLDTQHTLLVKPLPKYGLLSSESLALKHGLNQLSPLTKNKCAICVSNLSLDTVIIDFEPKFEVYTQWITEYSALVLYM